MPSAATWPTAFCYGTYLGPAELARHMPRASHRPRAGPGAFHQHCGQDRLQAADTDVINAFTRLDIASLWGDGSAAGADGSQISTWENNLLAETQHPVRLGRENRIPAYFRHLCRVVHPVHPVRGVGGGLHPRRAVAQRLRRPAGYGARRYPGPVAAPVYGLAALLGFDLLPRIRNWHDLIFFRPGPQARYRHIDSLFGLRR